MSKGMRGFPGMGGFGNMQGMLQKVQKMQAQMQQAQEELQARTFTGTAGGGVVKVVVTGKKELQSITLDPQAVDPDDVEMLQDLIVAAVNEAMKEVDRVSEEEMGKITGGVKLPGM
ncbi:MAG: YbaB/EbfC family nucleoid-associated protein [Succiniclasticum sp.]|jgi:nucleoid-associated protein EbfC